MTLAWLMIGPRTLVQAKPLDILAYVLACAIKVWNDSTRALFRVILENLV